MKKLWIVLWLIHLSAGCMALDIQVQNTGEESKLADRDYQDYDEPDMDCHDYDELDPEDLLIVIPLSRGPAEEMPVPIEVQVPRIMKILTFDRNFEQNFETEVNIGIVYTPEDSSSLEARDSLSGWLEQSAGKTLKTRPVKYIAFAYNTKSELEQAITSHQVNLLYITPGNSEHLKALLTISQTNQIITVTGVPGYVEQGVSVGFGLKENRELKIQINLASSKSEGIAFEAKLLKLAEVIR